MRKREGGESPVVALHQQQPPQPPPHDRPRQTATLRKDKSPLTEIKPELLGSGPGVTRNLLGPTPVPERESAPVGALQPGV